ncbi:MAG: hypothetical protein V4649_07500 [Bacteroidota bacterium]
MITKKLLLAAASVVLFGFGAAAQDRTNMEHKDGMDEADAPPVNVRIRKTMNLYSRDLISLHPFQYSENGVGVGISYEHSLDHDGYLAFYAPFIGTFNLNRNTGYYGDQGHNDMMLYAMPGIKFYPTGLGKCKYAIGPSAVVGWGQETPRNYYSPYPYVSYDPGTQDRFLFGMMINNSLNINPTPRLHVGLEMGFGFTYFDKIGGVNYGATFLTQGSFKIGYRF